MEKQWVVSQVSDAAYSIFFLISFSFAVAKHWCSSRLKLNNGFYSVPYCVSASRVVCLEQQKQQMTNPSAREGSRGAAATTQPTREQLSFPSLRHLCWPLSACQPQRCFPLLLPSSASLSKSQITHSISSLHYQGPWLIIFLAMCLVFQGPKVFSFLLNIQTVYNLYQHVFIYLDIFFTTAGVVPISKNLHYENDSYPPGP